MAVFQDQFVILIDYVRGGNCFMSSRTRRNIDGKIIKFKFGHPVFDGGIRWCMLPLCLSEWREFSSPPCFAGKSLITARVSKLLKSCVPSAMLLFSICNKKRLAIQYMNRTVFPTTLSIASYDMGN